MVKCVEAECVEMSAYKAVFMAIDGLEEREIQFRDLTAETIDGASAEAMSLTAPKGANFIKILAEGHLVHKIGIDL